MESPIYHFDVVPALNKNVTATQDEVLLSPGDYYNAGDITWMLASSALVLLMNIAISLLYSGMSRTSSLRMVWMPSITTLVVGLVWFLFGYAIAFSPSSSSSNVFWGGSTGLALRHSLFRPVGNKNGPQIPELVYALYQGMFACFTACLVSGATIYKEKTSKFLIFIVFWTILIYCPIAHWSWNPQGWSYKWGVYDFAGGTPVHICSGCSAGAYGLFYKWRLRNYNGKRRVVEERVDEEQFMRIVELNPISVVSGTILLWIGWIGFNGGSALGANLRAVSAATATSVAACAGGVTAYLLEMFYSETVENRVDDIPTSQGILRDTVEAVCTGAVAGMVAITPAAGYVPYYWAPLFGLLAVLPTYYAVGKGLNTFMFDPLGIFSIHAIPGFVGMLLTGFLASSATAALDGYTRIPGGCNFQDKHCAQIYIQVVDALIGALYSFVGTLIILSVMHLISRLHKNISKSERDLEPRYIQY